MNTEQLKQAQKEWGFSMNIWMENNRIYVANDGYITDTPLKMSKHVGECAGFYYFSKRKQTTNVLKNVIASICQGCSA